MFDGPGELEDRGSLLVYRDRANGVLIWWYGAPRDADIEDPAVWAFRGLRDANGQPIFQPSLTAGTPGTLYGESILYPTNGAWDATQADLIAGDVSAAILAVRQDISYKILTEAVISDATGKVILNLAQQDAVAMRAVMRVAFAVANPISLQAPTEATRFPFAVLAPAAP